MGEEDKFIPENPPLGMVWMRAEREEEKRGVLLKLRHGTTTRGDKGIDITNLFYF